MLGSLMTLCMTLHSNNTAATSYDTKHSDTIKDIVNNIYLLPRDTVDIDIDFFCPEPHLVKAIEHKKEVLYVMNTGDTICRQGGTRAWRNNNPGCLVYGKFTTERGAIGKGGKFAVFPNYETGRNALTDLLRSNNYKHLSIERAITKYAPPYENDVATYKKRLRILTGLELNRKICDLDSVELNKVADAICEVEGWREGNIVHRPGNTDMMASVKSKLLQDSMQNTL